MMMKPGTFRALIRNLRKANEMPTKKTGTKSKRKTTATRTAGKTARKATGTRVTAKSMAADIMARDLRRPGFYVDVRTEVEALWAKRHGTRAAQVMPREATH